MLQQDLATGRNAKRIPRGWLSFTRHLASALASLVDTQFLILEAVHSQRFVQFACCDGDGLRAEAISNAYLGADDQLGPDQLQALAAAGWNPPTHAPDAPAEQQQRSGSPNHYVDFETPVRTDAVAALAVHTLARIFGIAGPTQLHFHAGSVDGTPLMLPVLGLPRRRPHAAAQTASDAGVDPATAPAAPLPLQQSLLDALREVTSIDELALDADGDVAIDFMGQGVFLRIVDAGPWVRLWSLMVGDVDASPALLRRLNELNASGGFRLRHLHRAVFAEHDLVADPLSPRVLAVTLARFATAIDGLDASLQREFGGRLPPGRLVAGAVRH